MEYQFKQQFAAVYKMLEDEGSGVIQVKASSYGNEDCVGDVMEKGAFSQSIQSISKDNVIPMLFNHDQDKVIGHWYKAWDDDKFLHMEGKLDLGHSVADDVYINLKSGSIKGNSIGFNSSNNSKRKSGRGTLFHQADLIENSICTFPANPMAGVSSVKSMKTEREFENFLRDAGGYSREQAKAIVAGGYRSYAEKFGQPSERDAADDLVKALRAFDPLKI